MSWISLIYRRNLLVGICEYEPPSFVSDLFSVTIFLISNVKAVSQVAGSSARDDA